MSLDGTSLNGRYPSRWPGTRHLQRRIYPSNTLVERIIGPGGGLNAVARYSVTKDSNKSSAVEFDWNDGWRRDRFARRPSPGHVGTPWPKLGSLRLPNRWRIHFSLPPVMLVGGGMFVVWSDWLLSRAGRRCAVQYLGQGRAHGRGFIGFDLPSHWPCLILLLFINYA